jgi:FkbM family methyltransferase
MTFVSHAQNLEDLMLWRALKTVEKGFYIDVGAAWPDTDSVTLAFYLRGWHGINIEPHRPFFQKLNQNRPRDINLCLALGDSEKTALMHFFDQTGLSTLSDRFVDQHREAGWQEHTEQVQQTTLATLWPKHVPADQPVHFLKIDVEGLEDAVIRGNDWTKNRPWIVLVEATVPGTQIDSYAEWEQLLLAADYEFAYADGLNRFYVAREHAALLPELRYPPNVFDDYITLRQQQVHEELQQTQRANHQLRQQLHEANVTLCHQSQRADGAEQELARIHRSISWKITAPLRKLQAILRR